jgi:hypothetical protein
MIGGIQLRIHRRPPAKHIIQIKPETLKIRQCARVHIRRRLTSLIKIKIMIGELPQVPVLRRQRRAVITRPPIRPRRIRRRILHPRRQIRRRLIRNNETPANPGTSTRNTSPSPAPDHPHSPPHTTPPTPDQPPTTKTPPPTTPPPPPPAQPHHHTPRHQPPSSAIYISPSVRAAFADRAASAH